MNCISGPGDFSPVVVQSSTPASQSFAGPFFFVCVCNPGWARSEVPAQKLPPTHHGALPDAVQAPSCTVVATRASSVAVYFPIFPSFPFTLFLPSPSSVLFLPSSHSPAPALSAFSRLLVPRLTSAEGGAIPGLITTEGSP